jgi:hypothetical protein
MMTLDTYRNTLDLTMDFMLNTGNGKTQQKMDMRLTTIPPRYLRPQVMTSPGTYIVPVKMREIEKGGTSQFLRLQKLSTFGLTFWIAAMNYPSFRFL